MGLCGSSESSATAKVVTTETQPRSATKSPKGSSKPKSPVIRVQQLSDEAPTYRLSSSSLGPASSASGAHRLSIQSAPAVASKRRLLLPPLKNERSAASAHTNRSRVSTYIDVQWDKMRSLSRRAQKNAEDKQVYDWLSDGWWDDSYATSACARFRRMDKDGDGYVQKGEFLAVAKDILRQASKAASIRGLPKFGTARSYTQDAKDLFDTLDEDGDGMLSQQEFSQIHRHITLDIDSFYTIAVIKDNLEKIWNWNFDAFKLEEDSKLDGKGGIPLTLVTMYVFKEFNLFGKFHLDRVVTYNFIRAVEKGMRAPDEVAYHNRVHIADVVANMAYILKAPALDGVLTDEDRLICLLGALVHDMSHPGLTNAYMINSNAPEARQFNYTSVLENYHLHTALGLFEIDECNLFADYHNKKERQMFQRIRRGVVDVVLTTDMANHHTNIQMLELLAEQHEFGAHGVGDEDMIEHLTNTDRTRLRNYLRKGAMKVADIANPAKEIKISQQWSEAIRKEWELQNKRERDLDIEVSTFPLKNQEKGQIGFIKFVVAPLYRIFGRFCPQQMAYPLDLLESNLRFWENRVGETAPRSCFRNLSVTNTESEEDEPSLPESQEEGVTVETNVRRTDLEEGSVLTE